MNSLRIKAYFKLRCYVFSLFCCFSVGSILPEVSVGLLGDSFNLSMTDVLKTIDSTSSYDKRAFFTKEQRILHSDRAEQIFSQIKKEAAVQRDETASEIKRILSKIEEMQKVSGEESNDRIEKHRALSEARLQVNQEIIETWKLIESSAELNNLYLKTNIDSEFELQIKTAPISYYIEDIMKIEEKVDGVIEKIRLNKLKKEKVLRLILSMQEKVIQEKKELEHFLIKKQRILNADPRTEESQKLQDKNKMLDFKINLQGDQIKLQELKLRRLNLEISHLDDAIALGACNKRDAESLLSFAKSRLFISTKDLAQAQLKLDEIRNSANINRESNRQVIDRQNKTKLKLEEQLEKFEANLKSLALKTDLNKYEFLEQIQTHLAMINQKRQTQNIEYEIGVLELKNDLEELKVFEQLFKVRNLEMRLGLKINETDIKKYISLCKEERNQVDARLKQYDSRNFTDSSSDEINSLKAQIKNQINSIEEKQLLFKGIKSDLDEAKLKLEHELEELNAPNSNQGYTRYTTIYFEINSRYKQLRQKYSNLIKEMAEKAGEREIWSRSPRAISLADIGTSIQEAEHFFIQIFWETQEKLSPSYLISKARHFSFEILLFLLSIVFVFGLAYIGFRHLVIRIKELLSQKLLLKSGQSVPWPWTFLSSLFEFFAERFGAIFIWLAIHFTLYFNVLSILPFGPKHIDSYFASVFYLLSIPIFTIFAGNFLQHLSWINQKLSFFFFNEKTQHKNTILVTILAYSAAIILPLRQSFLAASLIPAARFPAVLIAAYSLIVEIVILLFLDKDDLLSIIPSSGPVFSWFKRQISQYYYPLFFFGMLILIIYNPYVGYFNLAWRLILLVPLSAAFVYLLVFLHEYLRKNILHLFIIEDEDGAQDRFEYAKLLYIVLVVGIFAVLCLLGFFLIARVWGFPYTLDQLWQTITTKWILQTQDGDVFGAVQIFQFLMTIISGFLTASLINNVFLSRLFDAFDVEPGLQNTIARINQYIIIFLFAIIGLSLIGYLKFVGPSLGVLTLGISFAIRDQASDIAAGIFILLERQFEVGHFIEIPSSSGSKESADRILGTVHKISFRSTIIRTARNFFIAVPNRIMISSPIINWGMGKLAIGMELNVEVEYGANPDRVKAIILKVLDNHHMILKVPAPIIRLDEFRPSGALFFARAFFTGRRVREIWNLASEIRIGILNAFKQEGIKIPYPQRVVSVLQGEKSPFDPDTNGININLIRQDSVPKDLNSEEE